MAIPNIFYVFGVAPALRFQLRQKDARGFQLVRKTSARQLGQLSSRFHSRIQAHQTGNHHRQKKLTTHTFDDRKPASDVRARHDVAVAKRRQGHKTEIEPACAREFTWRGESSRSDLLDGPVEQAEKNSRKEVSAQGSLQVLVIDTSCA